MHLRDHLGAERGSISSAAPQELTVELVQLSGLELLKADVTELAELRDRPERPGDSDAPTSVFTCEVNADGQL
jgi:hypothetical protein